MPRVLKAAAPRGTTAAASGSAAATAAAAAADGVTYRPVDAATVPHMRRDFAFGFQYTESPPSAARANEWLLQQMPQRANGVPAAPPPQPEVRPLHSLHPRDLAAFDRAHGAGVGLSGMSTGSTPDAFLGLPSVATDASKARNSTVASASASAAAAALRSPPAAAHSQGTGGGASNSPARAASAAPRSVTSRGSVDGGSGSGATSRHRPKPARDVFAFPSQSQSSASSLSQLESRSQSDASRAASQSDPPHLGAATLTLAITPVAPSAQPQANTATSHTIGTVPPSFTPRVATHRTAPEDAIVIPDSEDEESQSESPPTVPPRTLTLGECTKPSAHADDVAPTPTPPSGDSLQIPASTPSSRASGIGEAADAASSRQPITPPRSSMHSTRSLAAPIMTLDPHAVLPSLAQLCGVSEEAPPTSTAALDEPVHPATARLVALERDMRRMDQQMSTLTRRHAHDEDKAPDMTLSPTPPGRRAIDAPHSELQLQLSDAPPSPDGMAASVEPPAASPPLPIHMLLSESQGVGGTPPLAQHEHGFELMRAAPMARSTATLGATAPHRSQSPQPLMVRRSMVTLVHAGNSGPPSPSHRTSQPVSPGAPLSRGDHASLPAPSVDAFAGDALAQSHEMSRASQLLASTPPSTDAAATAAQVESHAWQSPPSQMHLQLECTPAAPASMVTPPETAVLPLQIATSTPVAAAPDSGLAPRSNSSSHASSMHLRIGSGAESPSRPASLSQALAPHVAHPPVEPISPLLPLARATTPVPEPASAELDLEAAFVGAIAADDHEPVASMSLELTFDEEEDETDDVLDEERDMKAPSPVEPTHPHPPSPHIALQLAPPDSDMRDIAAAASLALTPEDTELVVPVAVSPATKLLAAAGPRVGTASPALPITPRKPSIVSLPSSTAATQVQKASLTPVRSPATAATAGSSAAARSGTARLATPARAEEVYSSTQRLLSESPGKATNSPARGIAADNIPHAVRSPVKRPSMMPRGLRFDGLAATPVTGVEQQPLTPPLPLPRTDEVAAIAPAVRSGSVVDAADAVDAATSFMFAAAGAEVLTPCTPARASASHPLSSFDSPPPSPRLEAEVAPPETPTKAADAASGDDRPETSVSAPTSVATPVIPVAWSRARKPIVSDESVLVVADPSLPPVDAHDRDPAMVTRSPSASVHPAATDSSKRRGKVFAKQTKSTTRATSENGAATTTGTTTVGVEEPVSHLLLAHSSSPAASHRPLRSVIAEKPQAISLLTESQGPVDESQADESVDPLRRARNARRDGRSNASGPTMRAIRMHEEMEVPSAPAAKRHASPREETPRKRQATTIEATHTPKMKAKPETPPPSSTPARPALAVITPRPPTSAAAAVARRSTSPAVSSRTPSPGTTAVRRGSSPLLRTSPSAPPSLPLLAPSYASLVPRRSNSPAPQHYGSATKVLVRSMVNVVTNATMTTGNNTPDRSVNSPATVSPVDSASPDTKSPAATGRAKVSLAAILEETLSSVSSLAPIASRLPTLSQMAAASAARATSKPVAPSARDVHTDVDTSVGESVTPPLVSAPVSTVSATSALQAAAAASLPTSERAASTAAPFTTHRAPSPSPPIPATRSTRAKRKASGPSSSFISSQSSSVGGSLTASEGAASIDDDSQVTLDQPPKRTRRATAPTSASASAAPSTSRPTTSDSRSLFDGMTFVMTGLSKAESSAASPSSVSSLLTRGGGRVFDNLSDLPPPTDEAQTGVAEPRVLVIAAEPKRTMKFMYSLARGLPPLQREWVDACVRAGKLIDPTAAQTVALKDECGASLSLPRPWLRALQERRFLEPLALSRRTLAGAAVVVVGARSFAAEVAVVAREAGARVWSCGDPDAREWTDWNATSTTSETPDETPTASAAAASGTSRRRRSSPAAARLVLPSFDLICTDRAESLTAPMRAALTGDAPASFPVRAARKSRLPPLVSVRWLTECLVTQKRAGIDGFLIDAT